MVAHQVKIHRPPFVMNTEGGRDTKGFQMSNLPYIPLNVADFMSDDKVALMSTLELGAYMILLCRAWQQNPAGTLPTNDDWLARWTKLTTDEWEQHRDIVLMPFVLNEDVDPPRYEQRRMMTNVADITQTLNDRKEAATKAANARWNAQSVGNADAMLKEKKVKDKTESTSKRHSLSWNESDGWDGHEHFIADWKQAFPTVDIDAELKRMHVWLVANPDRRKKQYKRFVVAWLNRTNEKGAANASSRTNEYDESNIGRVISIERQ
tara:strand:+ start:647 stop:1441 length:795 start_codon:yes stop_codon:yes gene_type:complete